MLMHPTINLLRELKLDGMADAFAELSTQDNARDLGHAIRPAALDLLVDRTTLDLAGLASEIEKASPFDKCDGCETEIAVKAGADLAVTGFVDKLSDALISLQLFVRDAKTGEMKKTMSAEIRGNTDELWLHGLRWLWRNRFAPVEEKPAGETKQ